MTELEKTPDLLEIYSKIKSHEIDRDLIHTLIKDYSWEKISLISNQLREDSFGNKVKLCTIINAKSGSCDMDCRFCSQSRMAKSPAPHYPLISSHELKEGIVYSRGAGAKNCGIVTSGGVLNATDINQLIEDLEGAKKEKKLSLCGSFGRLSQADLERLKDVGIVRIHHNLESSKNFYPQICTSQTWESRRETVKTALNLGFQVCSGGLFGLGESWADRIDLALSLKELGVNSVPINFLHPHAGTAMGSRLPLTPPEALKIIGIYRIILPQATLRICGGRTSVLKHLQSSLFKAGANAIMTGDYLTTSGNSPDEDLAMIEQLGLEVEK